MAQDSAHEAVDRAVRRLNAAWVEGRVDDLGPLLHPDVTVAFPGFSGRATGRDEIVAGYREFGDSATIQAFDEQDMQIDVVADTAVATYRYELIYERTGTKYRSLGRDLWVLRRLDGDWVGVWRTMLDIEEHEI